MATPTISNEERNIIKQQDGIEAVKVVRYHRDRQGNRLIWWRNDNHRWIWEFDPTNGQVYEFRKERYERYRGGYDWISSREDTWSNPAYHQDGGFVLGLMDECPPTPEA